MYRHLLVPVDGTELSTYTAGQAVEFARTLGARITFFYATPDYSATGDGALQIAVAPSQFAETALGETRAILAKAASAATAKGVECSIVEVVSDRIHEAIITAAVSNGCDLIFMASHGHRGLRGMLRGSQTEKVVRNSPVPVLVSSVETKDPQSAANRALAVIQDEHRSLSVVIHGLLHFSAEALLGKAELDPGLIRRMIRYLHDFPGALHHPKEEKFIFHRLRQRTHEYDALIADLESQHTREKALVEALEQALDACEKGAPDGLKDFDTAMQNLARAIWDHMGCEEKTIFPAARRYLDNADWTAVAEAFEANNDPAFADVADDDFGRLFVKIANLLPKPSMTTGDSIRK